MRANDKTMKRAAAEPSHNRIGLLCIYGVAAIRRLLKVIGLFCRIWSFFIGLFCKRDL